jgi:hypothetical protein
MTASPAELVEISEVFGSVQLPGSLPPGPQAAICAPVFVVAYGC